MVKASVRLKSGRPGFASRLRRGSFPRSSHTSDLEIGAPVVTLPAARWYRVRTDRPGVSILWLGEIESEIFNFYLSVAACTLV